MKRFIHWLWVVPLVALIVGGLLPAAPARADQALPPYAWYAVAWTQEDDTLHWISALGAVASNARPTLPNEQPDAVPDMLISPDGRYLVLAAQLTTTNQGIGIYDLGAGAWVQTHEAQPGEAIYLGTDTSFSAATGRVAVGFMSGGFENPAWRVIVFELATGNALAVLDHTNPQVPTPQLQFPFVKYYGVDEGLGEEAIHIQFIPYGVGGSETWPAYRWFPFPAPANQANAIASSPYTRADSDVNLLSGEEVFAFIDPNYSTLPQMGPAPNNNAIGRAIPGVGGTTTVFADGTSWHFGAQWANSGQWVLYLTDTDQMFKNWNIILADGTPVQNQRTLLGPVAAVAGTPDGALMVEQSGAIRFTNNIDDASGMTVFTPNSPATTEIIYVTPPGVQFTLTSVGDADIVAIPPGPGDIAANCPGAPPARLTVGEQARVTITNGAPLNVRAEPDGTKLTEIAEGTVVTVVAGPQCVDGFNWWQINVVQGAAVSGWSAEGDAQNYYLEPWNGTVQLAPGAIQPVPTATPPVLVFATPDDPGGNPGDIAAGQICSLAPPTRLQVGMTVLAAPSAGTYAFFTNLSDAIPQNQVLPGTQGTVVGGPSCRNNYRMWQIQYNLNGQLVTGWMSEGTAAEYFIDPMS